MRTVETNVYGKGVQSNNMCYSQLVADCHHYPQPKY
jgi:hypothetical protein